MQSLNDATLVPAKNCEMASSQIISDEAFLICTVNSHLKCKAGFVESFQWS